MTQPYHFVLLQLNIPKPSLNICLDKLRFASQWVSGCTVLPCEGFGSGDHFNSMMERVKGLTSRQLILIEIKYEQLDELLNYLRVELKNIDIRFTAIPIIHCGRLN